MKGVGGQEETEGIVLKVNGMAYAGWKSARVTRGIESIAGSFELSVSERWAESGTAWPIRSGDPCSVVIGDSVLITGFIDQRSLGYSADDHTVSVSGRDKTGALVDCSAFTGVWSYSGISVLKFAQKVADPFSIPVSLQAGLTLPKPPKTLRIDPGDTAFNAIETACRLAGLLPVASGTGGLLLTRAGTARCTTELVEGENILSASADFDQSGRFHRYVVLGQHKGSDELHGESSSAVRGEALDEGVSRTERVLVIRPEHSVTVESAKTRAQWEATVRAGRAATVSITVQGWTQGNGDVWPINALVGVRSPRIDIGTSDQATTMLITTATYSIGEDGTKTVLTLKRPDAFKPEPTIAAATDGYWKEIVKGV